MTIDQTGIHIKQGEIAWTSDNAPVKYQFGISLTGPWHDTMQSADKYRRDSLDGGITWGSAYQFRGTNGSNGSDANVTFANIKAALQKAAGTESTFITADSVGAPNIYGGNIYGANIYAGDGSGSFAYMDGDSFQFFCDGISTPKVKIEIGYNGGQPRIDLGAGDGSGNQIFSIFKNDTQGVLLYQGSSASTMLVFNEDGSIYPFGSTHMAGVWDFTKATVKGVTATFA